MNGMVRLRAFAKLNLGLRVLYKRGDDFHELRTVFQTISLADSLTVSFTRARKTSISILGTPEIQDNLVERAAIAILEAIKFHADVRFTLKKHIPSGAGLGGGSSDAAAVLLAIPALAEKHLAPSRVWEIAARLGSDVPFFLQGGTALGLGRGEELYPLPDYGAQHALLIAPPVHSSTAEAYRDLSKTLTSIALQNKLFSFQQELWSGGEAMDSNDFEPVVFARHPSLKGIKARLLRAGAHTAAMTGSGSALFGLFENRQTRDRAKQSFKKERAFPVSFVSRAQYRSSFRRALKSHLTPEAISQNLWPPRNAPA